MQTKKLQILGSLGNKIYTQNEEPTNAPEGSLWIDLDAEYDISLDADTVDGKHASEFAIASDVETLNALVGDVSVSEQISTAVADKAHVGHMHDVATSSKDGFMSAEDKVKLDGIEAGANNYVHPNLLSVSDPEGELALYKINVNQNGHIVQKEDVTKQDIVNLGIPAQDTTYSIATQSTDGLMSAEDKAKLDSMTEGANEVVVDDALSSTSTNPVQNKVVNEAISGLSDLVGDTSVSTQISTAIDELIADDVGIYVQADEPTDASDGDIWIDSDAESTEITVDSALSSTSTNPVQNKVVASAIDDLNTKVGDTSVSEQISTAVANLAITDHTHDVATTTTAGFMSAEDKVKLDGITDGSNEITVDDALSDTSTNPVQNKVINAALANKSDADHTHSGYASASDVSDLQTKVGDESVSAQITAALDGFSSGKTLTEHLTEESMILTSLQYGDTLPAPGTTGRIFFKKVSS